MASADFNNDGVPDLAVANENSAFGDYSGTVDVLLGDGIGGFAPAVPFDTGGVPTAVVVGDFDNDGIADLAWTNSGVSNTVGVALGDGLGGFVVVTSFGVVPPVSLAAADFNNDGKADLAVVYQSQLRGPVRVFLGDGAGGFAEPALFDSGGANPTSIAVADFNNDGTADLAIANYNSGTVGVLLGDGVGGFAPAATFATGGSTSRSVAVGDFNNDGNADLAVGTQLGQSVRVLLGDGAGGFAPPVIFASGGSSPRSVAVGDFNNDGNADLAVANSNSDTVGVLLGDGAGGFAPVATFASGGSAPRSVAVGDFNNDGRTDLAVANYSSGTVGVLLNTTNQPPVNTVPGDQVVSEDGSKVIGGLSVADDDAAGILTVTLTAGHGTLTVNGSVAGGAAISGNGTTTVALTGTQAQINATLGAVNGLAYRGALNYSGLDTLTMTTTDADGLSDTDIVAIEVRSAQQQTQVLTAIIAGLEDDDVISPGAERLLITMLSYLSTPVGEYAAFVFRVQVRLMVVYFGTLTPAQGDLLIGSMLSIRNSLR